MVLEGKQKANGKKKKRKVGEEEMKWLSVGLEVIIGVGNVFLDGILTDEAHDIFFFSGHICFVCNNESKYVDCVVDWNEKKMGEKIHSLFLYGFFSGSTYR